MQEDTCELCYEYDLGCNDRCKYCALGNPCIGCADYDPVKDTCKSSGACGDPANKWKGTDCEVKDETD